MAGGGGAYVEINDASLRLFLRNIVERGRDPDPALKSIGEALYISHRARARKMISPEGTKWKPLSPEYRARKPKHKDRILLLDDHLIKELHYQILYGNRLSFGSSSVYAAIHQFGRALSGPEAGKTLPARPFIGMSDEDVAEATDILEEYLIYGLNPP